MMISVMYMLMRDTKGRKKIASKVKQTTRQSNTTHPRQSLFQKNELRIWTVTSGMIMLITYLYQIKVVKSDVSDVWTFSEQFIHGRAGDGGT